MDEWLDLDCGEFEMASGHQLKAVCCSGSRQKQVVGKNNA